MTSNDNQQYLTADMFNSKMETFTAQIRLENEKLRGELRADFQTGLSNIHNEIQAVHTEVQVNSARIDMLQHTFYWGFAIMTLVVAVVAVFVPYFLRERKEKIQDEKSVLTEEKVQDMIFRTVNNAVTKALGVADK